MLQYIWKKAIFFYLFAGTGSWAFAQKHSVFQQQGHYGVHENQAVLIEPKYDTIVIPDTHQENIFITVRSGQYYLVDRLGKERVGPFDKIEHICETATTRITKTWYTHPDSWSKVICPDQDYFIFSNKSLRKVKLYNLRQDMVQENWCDSVFYFRDTDRFLVVNGKNNTITDPNFKKIFDTPFAISSSYRYGNQHYYVVSKNNMNGILDSEGKLVFPFKYHHLKIITPDFIRYSSKTDGAKYGLTNLAQTYTIKPYLEMNWKADSNFFLISCFYQDSTLTCGMIDRTGKIIIPYDKKDSPPSEDYIAVIGGKYIWLNKEKKILDLSKEDGDHSGMEEIGDGIFGNYYKPLVRFRKNGLYGIMNEKGEVVIEPVHKTPEQAWKAIAINLYESKNK